MYLTWTPLRDLVGAGSDGKIETSIQKFNRKPKAAVKQSRSLSGNTETTLHRIDYIINISTIPIAGTTVRDKMREFASSVAAGETFTFDALGTEASPDNALTVTIIPNTYNESYIGGLIYSYSFQVQE